MTKKDYRENVVQEVMNLLRYGKINTATTNEEVCSMMARQFDDNCDINTTDVKHNTCMYSDLTPVSFNDRDVIVDKILWESIFDCAEQDMRYCVSEDSLQALVFIGDVYCRARLAYRLNHIVVKLFSPDRYKAVEVLRDTFTACNNMQDCEICADFEELPTKETAYRLFRFKYYHKA